MMRWNIHFESIKSERPWKNALLWAAICLSSLYLQTNWIYSCRLSAVTAISDPPGIRSTEFATPNSCSVIVKFNDKSSGFGYDLRTGISTANVWKKGVAYWWDHRIDLYLVMRDRRGRRTFLTTWQLFVSSPLIWLERTYGRISQKRHRLGFHRRGLYPELDRAIISLPHWSMGRWTYESKPAQLMCCPLALSSDVVL